MAFFWIASRRGFASLIGLLIVLVIIMYLMYDGYFKPVKGGSGKGPAGVYVDKAKVAACTANREALRAQISQVTMTSGGSLPSVNILRKKLGNYRCTERGGSLQIDNEGNVYCTLHDPAPESKSASVVNLQDDAALPTSGENSSSTDECQ